MLLSDALFPRTLSRSAATDASTDTIYKKSYASVVMRRGAHCQWRLASYCDASRKDDPANVTGATTEDGG